MTARRRWVPRILLLAIVVALGFGYEASLATTPISISVDR